MKYYSFNRLLLRTKFSPDAAFSFGIVREICNFRLIWLVLAVLVITGCKDKSADTYLTPEKAYEYFMSIDSLCDIDNGTLWGRNLRGPLLLIDRSTRIMIANQPDNEGLLKENHGVYTGTFPIELIINNKPVTYGRKVFALAPVPSEENRTIIYSSAIHSLFHLYQEYSGYRSSGFNTIHMDEKNTRVMLKLEWKALEKAINTEGTEKLRAIRDALIFKGAITEYYPLYAEDQKRFENYEGITTFTALMINSSTFEEYKDRLLDRMKTVLSFQSFARSYGEVEGAFWATLLFQKGFDIKNIRNEDFDIPLKVRELYEIELPEICRDVAGSLALNYKIEVIQKEETEREEKILENIHNLTSVFTEKPVVFIELESPSFDFEPEDVIPLDTLGTRYNTLRVSDNWGKLTVEKNGCLVSNNLRYIRITAKSFEGSNNHFSGDGWQLLLNNGWKIVPIGESYSIRRIIP